METYRQRTSFVVALFIGLAFWGSWRTQDMFAAPQGVLETPSQGSFQSGVGLIRGWVCTANRIDIVFDELGSLTAVYGEGREDTRASCGDSNNGFSLQFNWNDLGEGSHTVRALADGEEFGRATVTVATLGKSFFLGAQGEFPVQPFPSAGKTSRLRWLESRQQFVLSNGGTPATGGSSARADARLEDPQPGTFQSGIGVIRGWVCNASRVDVEVVGRGTIPAVYGEPRGDTKAACGDANNGFSIQINWNDLGDGNYTVRALADGAEFAQATFTVVTLGLGSFPKGLAGEFVLPDFPLQGRRTAVGWQESQQNFILTGARYLGIDDGVCKTQQGIAIDSAGKRASLAWNNPCLLAGNAAVLHIQSENQAALTEVTDERERRAASTGGFFLCATSLSIQQGQQTFAAGSFRLLDANGNEVCQEVPPGTTTDVHVEVEATSELNLNAPFTVIYNSQPVTAFQLSGPPSAAVLTVSPDSVSFDAIPVGSTQDKTFTITNTGSAILTGGLTLIASGSGAGAFALLSGDTVNVAPGQSQEVAVRYSALSNDVLLGSVRLSTNGGVATVILQGQGQQPPKLSVKPTSVNFGSVPAQGTANATFTVANIGGDVLTGSVSTVAPFSIVSGGSFTLGVGQRQTVMVRVTATTTGPVSATANVTSNGGGASVTLSAELATTGGTTLELAQLCTSPSILDFGSVAVNSRSELTFTIQNCGSGGRLTGNVTAAAPFSIVSDGSFSLGAGQSQVVTVRYSPLNAGGDTGGVTVSSNGGSATVTARGSGQPPIPGAQLSGVLSSLDFGTVTVGQVSEQTFTVTNSGGKTLTGSVSTTAPFSIVNGGSFSLEAGQKQVVTVRYSPVNAGPANGSVTVSSNGGSATVTVSGSGQPPTPLPQLSGVPLSLDFGTVTVGQSGQQTFTVSNGGGGTLTGSVSTSAPFSIVAGGSFSLGAGQNQTVTVQFTPTAAGPASGSVTVSSNGGAATVTLTGGGQLPVQLTLSTNSLAFGTVAVGQSSDQTFTVTNGGGGTLTGSVSTAAPFSIVSGGSFNLGMGQSQTVTVRFSPTDAGTFPGSVTVSSNGGAATVTARGSGQAPTPAPQLSGVPANLAFGTVTVGQSGDQTFTVTNSGGGTLTGSVTTTAPFSIVGGGNFSLGAGQNQTVTVRFTPTAAGVASGSITVSSNGGTATVTARGSGQLPTPVPQLSVSPTTFDFGSVPINSQSATQSFTITNSGGGTLTGTIEYTLSSPTTFSLQQGQSGTFFVYAVPSGPPGPFDIPILITSNGGDITLHLTGTAVQPPQLSFSPNVLDFGFVLCSSVDRTFTITNSGGGTLTGAVSLTQGSFSGYSIISGTSYNLSAGQSQSFTVRLTGAFGRPAASPANGTVDLGGSGASIQLTGGADCFS